MEVYVCEHVRLIYHRAKELRKKESKLWSNSMISTSLAGPGTNSALVLLVTASKLKMSMDDQLLLVLNLAREESRLWNG